jgi:hypothetical protein
LTTKGDGSASSRTDKHGKARLRLAPATKPGDSVPLILTTQGWVFISPWDGQVIVPSFENKSGNVVPLYITKWADRALLENRKGTILIISNLLDEYEKRKSINQSIIDTQRQAVLTEQAKQYGLKPEDIDKAIRVWIEKANDPYEKGLAEVVLFSWTPVLLRF